MEAIFYYKKNNSQAKQASKQASFNSHHEQEVIVSSLSPSCAFHRETFYLGFFSPFKNSARRPSAPRRRSSSMSSTSLCKITSRKRSKSSPMPRSPRHSRLA